MRKNDQAQDRKWPILTIFAGVFAGALAGCAKNSKDIQPTYISPSAYQSYSCDHLAEESARLRAQVTQLGGQVDEQASTDKVQMATGLILLWPTLFFLDGDTPQAQEYARLTGEHQALQQALNQRCNPTVLAAQNAASSTQVVPSSQQLSIQDVALGAGLESSPNAIPAATVPTVNIDRAKAKCEKIGFARETDKHAACVLEFID